MAPISTTVGAIDILPGWRIRRGARSGIVPASSRPSARSLTVDFLTSVDDAGHTWSVPSSTSSGSDDAKESRQSGGSAQPLGEGCSISILISHPSAPKRVLWDFLSLFFISWDIFMLPFLLLEPAPSVLFDLMTWLLRFFWTFDIPFTFLTGFITSSGDIVMDFTIIARTYLKTWFPLDVALVLLDWLEFLFMSSYAAQAGRAGKATRVLRVVRMLRLLRVARLREVVAIILERIHSERILLAIDILKIIFILLSTAHIMGCFWYGIGNIDGEYTWVTNAAMQDEALFLRYFISLHWALAQFTGGMDEVHAYSALERVYAVATFILCFVLATAFVSRLTSSMTQLFFLSSRNAAQMSVLRTFLSQRRIPQGLALRILRNAQTALREEQSSVPERNVELLQLVSEPLQMALHFQVYAPCFKTHLFFGDYCSSYPQVMSRVCHSALSVADLSTGDFIFHAYETPQQQRMYVLTSGMLKYTRVQGEPEDLAIGDFISEAALWVPWMHRGTLTSHSNSHVVQVDTEEFQRVALAFISGVVDLDPRIYAKRFVHEINKLGEEDITDLFSLSSLERANSK